MRWGVIFVERIYMYGMVVYNAYKMSRLRRLFKGAEPEPIIHYYDEMALTMPSQRRLSA